MNLKTIHDDLESVGYFSTTIIDYAVLEALTIGKPVLIEGDPGAGKTSLVLAVAEALGYPLVRLQMYDGLTDNELLYDYDYQRQLLTLEAIKPKLLEELKDYTVNDSIKKVATDIDFYGKDFIIPRPILQTIDGTGKKVLLIDEIDKASEETEYMLYEYLENYSITIPQYGKIECPENQKPIVFLTSNGYRSLSGAMKRRCSYLYIEQKTQEEILKILRLKTKLQDKIAIGVAKCLTEFNKSNLKHPVSISEVIDWANFLSSKKNKIEIANTIGLIAKDKRDFETIRSIIERNFPNG